MNHAYIFPTRDSCGMKQWTFFSPMIRIYVDVFFRVTIHSAHNLVRDSSATTLSVQLLTRDAYVMTPWRMNCTQH